MTEKGPGVLEAFLRDRAFDDTSKMPPVDASEFLRVLDTKIARLEQEGDFPVQELFVRQNGHAFREEALPNTFIKMGSGLCFSNAKVLGEKHSNLHYVEGHAVPYDGHRLFLHAWMVDSDGKVIDATRTEPQKTLYYGVIIPNAVEIMDQQGAAGVFEMNEPDIVDGEERYLINIRWMFGIDPYLGLKYAEWANSSPD